MRNPNALSVPALCTLLFAPLFDSTADEPTFVSAGIQPQAALSPDGKVFLTWAEGNTIFCSVSPSIGGSFSDKVQVAVLEKLAAGARRGPRIQATTNSVAILATNVADGNLYSWTSADGAKSWEGPHQVNRRDGTAREGFSDLAASTDGTLVAAWIGIPKKRVAEIRSAASQDGGKTWKEGRVYESPDGTVCPCCPVTVAANPKGEFFVLFRNALKGSRDMFVSRSSGGEKWNKPTKLGFGTWKLDKCPMAGGSFAFAADGEASTLWIRKGELFRSGFDGQEETLGQGFNPSLCQGPGGVYAAWELDQKLLFTGPDGEWQYLTKKPSRYPALAGDSRHGVIAFWQSPEGVFSRVLARADGTVSR